jgi:predicted transcriptional regulator
MYDELAHALGLKEAEVTVFSALIGRGAQPATRIAKWCNRSRNTVRGILDKLVHDGYVVRARRGNSHLYRVESVQGMSKVLRSKMELMRYEMLDRLKCVEKFTAVLQEKSNSRRPHITFYEGYDGLMKVYEDTLSSSETLRSWGSFDANQEAMPSYFKNYYKRRAKRKLGIRSIHPDTALARQRSRKNREELRESVLVDVDRFSIQPEIQVYDNKVNIVSWREKLGIIIENEEIAEAMKQIFELCFTREKVRRA